MFGQHSHPYVVQLEALWVSFLPAVSVFALIATAAIQHYVRNGRAVRQSVAPAQVKAPRFVVIVNGASSRSES